MTNEGLDAVETKVRPLYIVHVKGYRGTCSIAFDTPARALRSVDDLLAHGFNDVRICNAAGETLSMDYVRLLAER